MRNLIRNISLLPVIILFRIIPLSIVLVCEKIVFVGMLYQNFLDKHRIYWDTHKIPMKPWEQ